MKGTIESRKGRQQPTLNSCPKEENGKRCTIFIFLVLHTSHQAKGHAAHKEYKITGINIGKGSTTKKKNRGDAALFLF